MATLQDMLQSKPDYEDILKKFKQSSSQMPDEDADMKSKVQSDIDEPGTPEEAMDVLKNSAPRSRNVIPAEKVDNAIESGKVKSFAPEDLNNPTPKYEELLNKYKNIKNGSGVNEGMPVPKEVPLPENGQAPSIGKYLMKPLDIPTDAEDMPEKGGLPAKKIPTVEGQGTSNAKFDDSGAPIDGEIVPSEIPHPMMNGAVPAVAGGIMAGKLYKQLAGMGEDLPPPVANNGDEVTKPNVVPPMQPPPPTTPPLANIPPMLSPPTNTTDNVPAALAQKAPELQTPPANPPMPASVPSPGTAQPDIGKLIASLTSSANDNKNGLAAAQAKANQNEYYANLMHSMNQLGAGIIGAANKGVVTPTVNDKELYDSLIKNTNSPVDQFNAKIANEKNDPTSSYSKTMRDFLAPSFEKLGIKMDDNTPASVLEKVAPWATAQVKNQEYAKYNATIKGKLEDDKVRAEGFKDLKEMRTAVEAPSFKTSRSAIGKNQANIDASDRALGIINAAPGGDLNKLTYRDAAAIMNDYAQVVSNGGVASAADKAKFMPNAIQSYLARGSEFLGNTPEGAQLGSFIQQTKERLNEQKSIAQKQMNEKFAPLFKGYSPSALGHPEVAPGVEELKKYVASKGQEETSPQTNITPVNPTGTKLAPGEHTRLDPKSGRSVVVNDKNHVVRWAD